MGLNLAIASNKWSSRPLTQATWTLVTVLGSSRSRLTLIFQGLHQEQRGDQALARSSQMRLTSAKCQIAGGSKAHTQAVCWQASRIALTSIRKSTIIPMSFNNNSNRLRPPSKPETRSQIQINKVSSRLKAT
jgi:hypothetical protein